MNMILMHLMIQRKRLKLFGRIVRMKGDRRVKQFLFEEIEGVRFEGRPNMQWIACIIEDLKTFNISNNPKEDLTKIGNFTLDQVTCRSFMERQGIDLALIPWMEKIEIDERRE